MVWACWSIKSLSRNLLNLSRDQHSKLCFLHVSFSTDFCTCVQNFLCFQSLREIGYFKEGSPALFFPNAPVLPLHRSVGKAGQDVLCQENPPRGPPWRQHSLCQAEPSPQPSSVCCRVSACHEVRKCPELLLGENTRTPRCRLEILVREKEARTCCLRCFKTYAISLAWA